MTPILPLLVRSTGEGDRRRVDCARVQEAGRYVCNKKEDGLVGHWVVCDLGV